MTIPSLIYQLAKLRTLPLIILAVHRRDLDISPRRIIELLREVERLDGPAQSGHRDLATTLIRLHLFGVHEVVFQTVLSGEIGGIGGMDSASQIELLQWVEGKQSHVLNWAEIDELRKSAVRRRVQVKKIIDTLGGVPLLVQSGELLGNANLASICRVYRALKSLRLLPQANSRAIKLLACRASLVLPKLTTGIPSANVIATIGIFADVLTLPLEDGLLSMFAWDKGALELSKYPTNGHGFDPTGALASFRLGLQHAPVDKRPIFKESVAQALCEVSKIDPSKVNEAIDMLSNMRASLDIDGLSSLGRLVTERFIQSGVAEDATLALDVWNQVIASSSDSIKGEAQINLATVLELAAKEDQEGLQRAVILRRKALPLLQDGYSQCYALVASVRGLLETYELHHKQQDFDELQLLLKEALLSDVVAASPQIALELLKTYALGIRWGLVGSSDQWDRADEIARSLLAGGLLPASDSVFVSAIRQFVTFAVWELTGQVEYLEAALQQASTTLRLAESHTILPPGCSLPAFLQARAICYLSRYQLREHPEDLRCAHEDLQNAISVSSHLALLSSQAVAILDSHVAGLANDSAIEKAIDYLEIVAGQSETVEAIEWVQWSLGNLLLRSYSTRGIVAHLYKGAAYLRAAAQVLKPSRQPQLALSLAQALYHLFLVENQLDLLNEAITFAEDSLESVLLSEPDRWSAFVTLANALQERFLRLFRESDSLRAEELLQKALSALGPDAAYHKSVVGTLVGVLIEQHQADIGEDCLERASEMAKMLAPTPSDVLVLDPQIASNMAVARLLTSSDRQQTDIWLSVLDQLSSNLPNSTAALMAAQNWMHQAYGAGRWSDVAKAYERICAIRQRVVAYNDQFVHLEAILRRFQHSGAIAALSLVKDGKYEQAAHLLDESQATLLRGAGATKDDHRYEKVWDHVDQVWYLASTRYGGFAIVVSVDGARGVLLPELTPEREASWCTKRFESLVDMGRTTLDPLKNAAGMPGRLVLIPIGALSSLPWAAAPVEGKSLLDCSVLRVLPSMDFFKSPPSSNAGKAVLVEVLEAPAHAQLNHATAEVAQIGAWLPDHHVLRGDEATKVAVITALCEAPLVHFACHGLADTARPVRSSLLLGRGESLSVAILARLKSSNGNFAFLSACETANGGQDMPDEFANIAAAFLACGFKGAIGSLTKVNDVAASILARRFYWQFVLEGDGAAEALRHAQMWLRDATATEVSQWLDTLGPAATPDEASLRTNLSKSNGGRIFAHPKYWSPFVYYGV